MTEVSTKENETIIYNYPSAIEFWCCTNCDSGPPLHLGRQRQLCLHRAAISLLTSLWGMGLLWCIWRAKSVSGGREETRGFFSLPFPSLSSWLKEIVWRSAREERWQSRAQSLFWSCCDPELTEMALKSLQCLVLVSSLPLWERWGLSVRLHGGKLENDGSFNCLGWWPDCVVSICEMAKGEWPWESVWSTDRNKSALRCCKEAGGLAQVFSN